MIDQIVTFLKNVNELETGKILIDTFAKYASRSEEYDIIAKSYMDIKQYPLAIKFAEKALISISSNEGMYACRANLAKLHNHINDPKSSLRYSSANRTINPTDFDPMLEQVFSYFLLNQKDKSEDILRDLLAREHELPENVLSRVKFNLGTYDLYKGKFQQGLKGFLIEGKKLGIWKQTTLPFKFWDGGVQPGKTIVLYAEGGIGDEIINVRFCKHFIDLGMNPLWYTTRKELFDVFSRNNIPVINNLKDVPEDSLWTYSMSIPVYLDVQENQLWEEPYLTPNPEYTKKWGWIKKSNDKVKVGIRWTGNPEYEHDLHRGLPLDQLYEVLKNEDIELYSIQRDFGADQITQFPDIIDLQDKLETIEDTLAVIDQMDYIITSCTSIVHMAAAMGKPTIVIVPITAYYTWASTLDQTSIWYPNNVCVLRQCVHKSWKEPFDELSNLVKFNKFSSYFR